MNKLYNLFLSNTLKNIEYKIKLKDGSEIVGIPRCYSYTDSTNIKFHVTFKNEDGESITHTYNIDDVIKAFEC